MAYEDVRSIKQEGPSILINDQTTAVLAETAQAEFVTARLRTIWQTPARQREVAVGALLDEVWDSRVITKRWSLLLQTTASLRSSCAALFFLAFVGGPLVLYVSRVWGLFG